MSILKKYSLVFLLMIAVIVYFRWVEIDIEQNNGIKITYKKDRWTSQVWKQVYGIKNDSIVEQEFPIHTDTDIQKEVVKVKATSKNQDEVDQMKSEIKVLKKIMDETGRAHALYNDTEYVGEYNLADFEDEEKEEDGQAINLGNIFSQRLAHEKAVEKYRDDHIKYIESSNQVSRLESEIQKIEDSYQSEATKSLTESEWMIRYTLSGIWIILSCFFFYFINIFGN
jgi:hypothetical protein